MPMYMGLQERTDPPRPARYFTVSALLQEPAVLRLVSIRGWRASFRAVEVRVSRSPCRSMGPTSTICSLQAMEVEEKMDFICARQPSERWCCIWASAIFGKGGPGRAAVDSWRRVMRARNKMTLTHSTTLSDPRGSRRRTGYARTSSGHHKIR